MRAALLLLLILSSCAAAQTCSAPFNAGYQIVTFSGVNTGVWYPSSDTEAPYTYAPGLTSTVAFNGSILGNCGTFPLLLFSHGFGGCGIQSVFITEQLAREGFIVAAPDHQDALCSVTGTGNPVSVTNEPSFFDPQSWNDTTYVNRKNDIETVIDGMLSSPTFGASVDSNRIAGSGHSLGGYTIAGMVGGWASWTDSRIRVALLFSPYILPFMAQNTVADINTPVMYQGGQLDIGITPFIQGNQGAYAMSNAPKFFPVLGDYATHFEWTNLTCINYSTVAACLQAVPDAQLIDVYSTAFLNRYLNGTAQPLLLANGAGLYQYSRATLLVSESGASFASSAPVSAESIVTGFGDGLASGSTSGTLPLQITLSGVTVTITDQKGNQFNAPLYLVSPGQINYVLPSGVALGDGTVTVQSQGVEIASGPIQIANVAPALFSAAGTGEGVAAADFVTIAADGSRTEGLIFDPDTLQPVPINVTAGQVYLELYGTGLRFGSATAAVAGVDVQVQGPVPQSQYPGLDQANIGPLPASLAGSGVVSIVLSESGIATNGVTVAIQ